MKIKIIAAIFAVLPLVMKCVSAAFVSLSLLAPVACQRTNLFEAISPEAMINPIFGAAGEATIALEIVGNGQAVDRALSLAANGFVRYREARCFAGEMTSVLSSQEYGSYVALFLEKDFLHLAERYESSDAASPTRYRLTFKHGGSEKTVQTDSVNAPTSVQQILAHCAQHMATLRNTALTLALATSRDTLVQGESVQFTFNVTNPHAHPVPLRKAEQLVEFFLAAPAQLAQQERSPGTRSPYVWRESASASSIHANASFELAAGKQLEFSTVWNGRDSNGVLLEGTYWLAARLATIPGGISAWRAIHVARIRP